jgi:hypothetical protein
MSTVVDPTIVDYLMQADRQAGRQSGRQIGMKVADR